MLAAHEPHIGHLVASAKNTCRRNLSGKFIGETWIARYYDRENSAHAQEPVQLSDCSRKIGKMLKDVHGDCAVKLSVLIRHSVLARTCHYGHCGEAPFDFRGHIFSQLDTMVVLARQVLELQMAAGSGANLDGAKCGWSGRYFSG